MAGVPRWGHGGGIGGDLSLLHSGLHVLSGRDAGFNGLDKFIMIMDFPGRHGQTSMGTGLLAGT